MQLAKIAAAAAATCCATLGVRRAAGRARECTCRVPKANLLNTSLASDNPYTSNVDITSVLVPQVWLLLPCCICCSAKGDPDPEDPLR